MTNDFRVEGAGLLGLRQGLEGVSQGIGPGAQRGWADFSVGRIDAHAVGADVQEDSFKVGDHLVVLSFRQHPVINRYQFIRLFGWRERGCC